MSRCCARCKTPYNCGNPNCRCHDNTRLTTADVVTAAQLRHHLYVEQAVAQALAEKEGRR